MNIISKIKKALGGEKTLSDYLAEAGLEESDLQELTASLDVDTAYLKESQKAQLANEEGFKLKSEHSHFTGMEVISCTSSAITIISALISLEKWVGARFFVTITLNGMKQRVTVNQAMEMIFEAIKNKTRIAE